MSSNYTTNAINIKSYNLSESDRLVLMYSKDKGLIKGVAKGAKKFKSKLGGRMDLLVANKLMLYKGKNLDTICQAEALNTFNNIRTDMNKMLYGMYVSEMISNFGLENDPNSNEIYDLFYGALSSISKATNMEKILLAVMRFQLKLMKFNGYEFQLDNCVRCGKTTNTEIAKLSIEKGGLLCQNCSSHNSIQLSFKLVEFMKYLSNSDFDSNAIYDQKATEKICKYCFSILKKYIQIHSEKEFKTTKLLT